jgi:uncharacterized protein
MAKMVINCTHGEDNPERAPLSFVVGNIAASADQETIVLLTIEGVWLATHGCAGRVHKEGFPPLSDVMRSFVDNGGQIWACGACAKPRGIAEADMIPGARIVTAASVVEQLLGGAASMTF